MRAYRRKRLFASFSYVTKHAKGFGQIDLYFGGKHLLSPTDLKHLIALIERENNISGVVIINYKFM